MASNPGTGTWFVRTKDRVLGPCTAQQISDLLKQGVVQTSDFVSQRPDSGPWQRLCDVDTIAIFEDARPFHPPPRPAVLQNQDETAKHPIISGEDLEQTNPTLTLFNTLQAAKDRRPRGSEPILHPAEIRKPFRLTLPPAKWIAAGAAAIALLGAAWALPKLFKSGPKSGAAMTANRSDTSDFSTKENEAPSPASPGRTRPEPAAKRERPPTLPANANLHREGFSPRSAPAPAEPVHSPPESYEDIPPAFENRGTFDDPVEPEPIAEPGENDLDAPPRETGEELSSPPHLSMPQSVPQDATHESGAPPAGVPLEGSNFPPPSFN